MVFCGFQASPTPVFGVLYQDISITFKTVLNKWQLCLMVTLQEIPQTPLPPLRFFTTSSNCPLLNIPGMKNNVFTSKRSKRKEIART